MIATQDRALPANLDCERLVLGMVQLDYAGCAEYIGDLQADEFSTDRHRKIWRAMQALEARGEQIDRVTVAEELQRRGELEAIDGLTYLLSLDDGLPRLANISGYVKILKEKALLRSTIRECQRLSERCYLATDDSTEIISTAQSVLGKLQDGSAGGSLWSNPGDVIRATKGGLNGLLSPAAHGAGILTPWGSVNRSLQGMQPGELIVIAARPSMGKSVVGMQIAHYAAAHGHGAAFISLEMSKESLIRRLICAVGQVDSQRMRSGCLDERERKAAAHAASQIADLPLWIDESRAHTVPAVTTALRKIMARSPVSLLIIDHLQLMRSGSRTENRTNEMSEISHGLKRLAGQFNIVVVLLSQLNRECEKREGHIPQLSDLKESGAIEEDADVVWFIHRPERYARSDESLRGHAEFIIAKQRNGPVGKLHMHFHDVQQRFEESTERRL